MDKTIKFTIVSMDFQKSTDIYIIYKQKMLYKFTLAILLTITLITLYKAIIPIIQSKKNFIPLRTTFPAKHKLPHSRCDTLTKCDPGVRCGMCGSDYECTPVGANENVIFKGQKVPEGLWCLPKGKRNLNCGTYTGRAIWTKDRGWECACLYPDLFSGHDCNQQIACKLPGELTTNFKLVNKETGHTWDPSDPNFDPQGTTPYDRGGNDIENQSLYQCNCADDVSTLLPGDPYRCHKDPCTYNHSVAMWDPDTLKCDCTAKGATSNQYAYSNITKQCVRTTQCNWDDINQKCMCSEDQVSKVCDSKTMARPNAEESCPNIHGGSYCINPCEGYCQNGSIPSIIGDKCHCKCISRGNVIVSGKRCEKACLKDGTIFHQGKCCNGSHRVFNKGGYDKVCGPSSCFLAGSMVTLSNGDRIPIETVKVGDEVKAASGSTTRVLVIDKTIAGEREIVGFNGIPPFMTEDHCIVDLDSTERLTFNAYLAREQKHWNDVRDIIPGDVDIHDITRITVPKDTTVYDVITEDHTLIVNGIRCYDDMPEVESHPFVAVIMAKILKYANTSIPLGPLPKYVDKLFNDTLIFVLIELENEDITIKDSFDKELQQFMKAVSQDNMLLHIGSNLWKTKFNELKRIEHISMFVLENLNFEVCKNIGKNN